MEDESTVADRNEVPPDLPLLQRIFRPHKYAGGRKLFRCSCGGVYWDDAPKDIYRHHNGHTAKLATDGTKWEYLYIRTGMLYPAYRFEMRWGVKPEVVFKRAAQAAVLITAILYRTEIFAWLTAQN